MSLHYHPFLETREEIRHQQERINAAPAVFDEYEELVRACVELCQRAGSIPVLVILPGNLPQELSLSPREYFRGSAQEHRAPDYGEMCQVVNHTRDLSAERIFRVQKEMNFTVVDARRAFEGLDYTARQALFYKEKFDDIWR